MNDLLVLKLKDQELVEDEEKLLQHQKSQQGAMVEAVQVLMVR